MIGILLNDHAYEQDIRELLMAFYPGETFVYEEKPEALFYLKGRVSEDRKSFQLTVGEACQEEGTCPILCIEADYDTDRFETKNRIKRGLYDLLKEKTGKVLPWGTLTGIRPSKIVTSKLEQGQSRGDICRFMKEKYLVSEEKTELTVATAEHERELLSDLDYRHGYSLYVGIPFCPTTCLYCSFTSFPIGQWKDRTHLYLEALYKEMEYVSETMSGQKEPCHLDTVYFGGGTPTSLSAEELDQMLTKLEQTYDLSTVKELTVEAGRPDSITREKLEVLKKHHVTRISINPQTMKQQTLDIIGRHHTVDMVKECFLMARELGFDNINMDLIVGLPDEDTEDVRRTMEEIRALDPDSITVHSLAIKRAARLNIYKERYENLIMTSTQEMIDLTSRYAQEMGMQPYYLYRQKNMAGNFENVGYAKPGKACLYNILIMEEKQTIAACGAGTSTKVVYPEENRLERIENVKDVEHYIRRIDEMLERKALLRDRSIKK